MKKKNKTKKSKIKIILENLLNSGFFNEWRTTSDVVKKLSQKGFTVRGKKIGMISRMLTEMCQDLSTGLERDEIAQVERTGRERWKFKKMRQQ